MSKAHLRLIMMGGLFLLLLGSGWVIYRLSAESGGDGGAGVGIEGAGTQRAASAAVAGLGFVATVKATEPIAYFRLESESGVSEVGTTRYKPTGGVVKAAGAPLGMGGNGGVLLDGRSGWIETTQEGGISIEGSLMAWVNLSVMPNKAGHIMYVAGESAGGNDFDLQFETDNKLKFYTEAGSHADYKPDAGTLVGKWHMIVVTMNMDAKSRCIYWDGQPVAADHANDQASKVERLTIGASSLWEGRFFAGGIDEVALWDRALSAGEVLKIYDAAR